MIITRSNIVQDQRNESNNASLILLSLQRLTMVKESNQGGNSGNGTQVVGNVHNATFHHGGGNNNAQHHQNPYGKLTRLDFPRFNRDDGEKVVVQSTKVQ
ncbi:hypothetical protein Tco_0666955 [Tanacetum coccineum]